MIFSHLYIKSGIITVPNTSMIKEIYFPSLIFVLYLPKILCEQHLGLKLLVQYDQLRNDVNEMNTKFTDVNK